MASRRPGRARTSNFDRRLRTASGEKARASAERSTVQALPDGRVRARPRTGYGIRDRRRRRRGHRENNLTTRSALLRPTCLGRWPFPTRKRAESSAHELKPSRRLSFRAQESASPEGCSELAAGRGCYCLRRGQGRGVRAALHAVPAPTPVDATCDASRRPEYVATARSTSLFQSALCVSPVETPIFFPPGNAPNHGAHEFRFVKSARREPTRGLAARAPRSTSPA